MGADQGFSRKPEFAVKPSALVTGASGFVGVHLCRRLVERDWRLVAGYRRMGPGPESAAIAGEYLPLSSEPGRWQAALGSIDCVVHLAAHVHQMGPAPPTDDAFDEINVQGSRFVAEQCARAGVKRLVYLSSAKVNGEGGELHAYGVEDPPDPRDAYARSKLAAEVAIRDVCERTGMQFAIIRPPLVYGTGVRANFQSLVRLTELGLPLPLASIDNRRSLIGVWNLVDFIETCMTHPDAAGRVWLVSDGEDISTPDLIRRLARAMQGPARLFPCPPVVLKTAAALAGRSGEVRRLCDSFTLDSSPARELLNWKPPMNLDEGLARTVADYRMRRHV